MTNEYRRKLGPAEDEALAITQSMNNRAVQAYVRQRQQSDGDDAVTYVSVHEPGLYASDGPEAHRGKILIVHRRKHQEELLGAGFSPDAVRLHDRGMIT
ncbi:hypothetical protein [Kitasatospora sp. NPDC059673]|uniref:hypothetical protein n=1 Tax=Kitasatospora sp. NPDC059673 TaxID=3346901 RepID=UPI00368480C8